MRTKKFYKINNIVREEQVPIIITKFDADTKLREYV